MFRAERVVLAVLAAACLVAVSGCMVGPVLAPATPNAVAPMPARPSSPTVDVTSSPAKNSPDETASAVVKTVRIGMNGSLPGSELPDLVARSVRAAGGVPVRLDPKHADVGSVDGIVLVGGADIHPQRYGEAPSPKTSVISSERETFDLGLARKALDRGIPVLGICLGAQELWVAQRGTLVQDIPTEVGTGIDHRARDRGQQISFTPDGTLAGIYGRQRLSVYSNHHQSVDPVRVPEGFRVGARSSDGVVEGFESTAPTRFVIGVNWHPEHRDEGVLFKALVEAARTYRAGIPANK
jgi:putative glutamine amidotransferase